ncbi:MAG: DNA alkylation repair protein [Bacteroidota bacterium]|nr:DNA alkylation repair protein [Bacteroidota bacterium]
MNCKEVLRELEKMGTAQTRKTWANHGAKEPFFGVKIGDMKIIQKKVKKDYELSLQLYDSGNSDAMYLAGLIADEKRITKEDLQRWAENASWHMVSEFTVPWIAAESFYGWILGMEWIDSPDPKIASCGWATLASVVSLKPDAELNIQLLDKILNRVAKNIHSAPNRVRYTMNGFVIAVGSYIESLTDKAIATAEKIGNVEVEMGGTCCKVPTAKEYILKVKAAGKIGKKRKEARC